MDEQQQKPAETKTIGKPQDLIITEVEAGGVAELAQTGEGLGDLLEFYKYFLTLHLVKNKKQTLFLTCIPLPDGREVKEYLQNIIIPALAASGLERNDQKAGVSQAVRVVSCDCGFWNSTMTITDPENVFCDACKNKTWTFRIVDGKFLRFFVKLAQPLQAVSSFLENTQPQ